MLLWRYEQSRKERLGWTCVRVRVCRYTCVCVCVNIGARVDEKEERDEGVQGVVGGRGRGRRRLLLLSLFEQTRSFTSATRREPDIMPLMSAPADCTIDVALENFLFVVSRKSLFENVRVENNSSILLSVG